MAGEVEITALEPAGADVLMKTITMTCDFLQRVSV